MNTLVLKTSPVGNYLQFHVVDEEHPPVAET